MSRFRTVLEYIQGVLILILIGIFMLLWKIFPSLKKRTEERAAQ